jgi:ATP-dependent DNA ligase
MSRIVPRSASLAATKRSARETPSPPRWIEPQLCNLVAKAPSGPGWVHEVKFDGYRMAARIDRGDVQLLTRSGLDWTEKYPETAAALAEIPVASAYIDGELCGVGADGLTSFELMQQATIAGPARSSIMLSTLWNSTARRSPGCRCWSARNGWRRS